MFVARDGSPCLYTVTVSLPQLAVQMLPCRSDAIPCGQVMRLVCSLAAARSLSRRA